MPLKDYQIITKLGAGSFGVVFRVKLKKSNQLYVVKQIQLSRLDARLRKWSMNEAKLMKEINSPYIVKYIDSFVEASKLYIVMQHCSKGDLCKYIKSQMGKPIKQQTIWKFVIQIMIGLHRLHSKKILHRDIKTLNIFLDDNCDVRIGDLGTAKTLSTEFTNTIVGTPYYLSPQLCEEKPYNEKTDIWAFGCLVYELCTGKHPFQAQNQAALALKIVMGKFQDIPSFYSKDLRWIVHSCLSVDYKRRPTIHYLLERPFVIQNAKKLNLNLSLSSSNNSQKPEKQLQTVKKQLIPIPSPIQQIQSIVNNVNKKVDQAVKKVHVSHKAPIPQFNKPKPELKISQEKQISKKEYDSVKKAHEASLQKRKQIDQKRGHLPVKPEQKKVFKNIPAAQQNNKSKEKVVKIQNPPPVKVVINEKNAPIVSRMNSNEVVKKQAIQTKKQQQKPRSIHQTQNMLAEKRKSVPAQQMAERASLKRQFNVEDQNKLKKEETLMVKNLDCLDISKKPSKSSQQIEENSLMNAKKTAFVNYNIQKQINDDELMAEFGITPQKKEVLKDFSLIKTKSINWDLQTSKNSSIAPNESKLQHTNKTKTIFKEFPTIKTTSHTEEISVIEDNQQENKQGYRNQQQQEEDFVPQDEDNKPYKSDDQEETGLQKEQTNKQGPQNDQQAFQDQQDSRYLIENIQAQFAEQGKQSLQKQIQQYSKRLLQNQKRLIHLQKMRNHTQKQYFSHLSKQTYQKLKEQINSQNDKQVDKLMKELTKGKEMLVVKFLKIMGFQMEIEMCQKNVNQCKLKIKELKQKNQKGEWI